MGGDAPRLKPVLDRLRCLAPAPVGQRGIYRVLTRPAAGARFERRIGQPGFRRKLGPHRVRGRGNRDPRRLSLGGRAGIDPVRHDQRVAVAVRHRHPAGGGAFGKGLGDELHPGLGLTDVQPATAPGVATHLERRQQHRQGQARRDEIGVGAVGPDRIGPFASRQDLKAGHRGADVAEPRQRGPRPRLPHERGRQHHQAGIVL